MASSKPKSIFTLLVLRYIWYFVNTTRTNVAETICELSQKLLIKDIY